MGRDSEIKDLLEWMDDEDSRYCLVYGDGGYGKTTLVLEFLNLIMESNFDFKKPTPEIISYYSAKKTRWNESGLIHFTSISPAMDECIRELIRCFNPLLQKQWYGIKERQIIDKAVGILKNEGYTRDDILLIIDNTETLATSTEEVKELASFFMQIGKLVGRLIITSRRREFVPATPICIEGLTEEESISLMKNLAKEYHARPIIQSGDRKLRKVSKQLMRKPILLEALVKYVSHSNIGIDTAISNVFKKSNEELLEFLYDDAWHRMNNLQREVFLVIIHIISPLDQNSIGKTCQEIGLPYSEFEKALEETHFAILTDYGKNYFLELVDLANDFFFQKFGMATKEEKERLKSIASVVDIYSKKREEVEKNYKTDRVAEAFRSEYAKSAKVYADKGDINRAIEMYDLAIEDDPLNPALHDRYSWLLLNRTAKFERAKDISKKAVSLDPSYCDGIVGLALAYYRLGNITKGDIYIDKAIELGRSYSFCFLRKGIARYHKAKIISDLDKSIRMLEDAFKKLTSARNKKFKKYGYDAKTLEEIIKYQDLTNRQLSTLRRKRTIDLNRNI